MEKSRRKLKKGNIPCQRTVACFLGMIPKTAAGVRDSRSESASGLFEDPRMCESLRQIVNGFTGDVALQQDMLQECLVCLWKVEAEKPGRTRSWYLQNCRFHVQHWLAAGRSLDSHKRAIGGKRIAIDPIDEEGTLGAYHTNGELFELVSARDLVSTLTPHLKPIERTILLGLADGLVLREIASKFDLSYPTALKYRRRIASLAARLGVSLPFSASRSGVHTRVAKRPIHDDVTAAENGIPLKPSQDSASQECSKKGVGIQDGHDNKAIRGRGLNNRHKQSDPDMGDQRSARFAA
jgi:DNA-binding CsgD family transcriptional regulator